MPFYRKFLLFLCGAVLCGVLGAEARPAYPHPIVLTQSDGTQITVRIVGDESFHYVLSSEGYALASGRGGDYYYADLSADGRLVPTSVLARPLGMLNSAERKALSGIRKGLKPSPAAFARASRMRKLLTKPSPQAAEGEKVSPPERISTAQTLGNLRSLVILVETSDLSFQVSSPQSAFSDLLNQPGYGVNGATGSAWDYYNENSNGKFNPEFVVVGPYRLSKKSSYYAGCDGSEHAPEMIVDACKAADAAGVDFSQFADNGVIRDVFVFYAGHNQAEGARNTVWPHRYDVRGDGYYESFDGQELQGYACSSELQGASGRIMTAIGAFCHEFGHVLGWPDFYDTDESGSGGEALALEEYSLMCAGSYNNDSRTPPALNILERWMVGWAEPQELTLSGSYTLGPVWKDEGYLIRTDTDNEYFLLENHATGESVWDQYTIDYMGESGMLVYHIDYSDRVASKWQENTLNNNPSHECAKLVRSKPGSGSYMGFSPGQTFFPGAYAATELLSGGNSDYTSWYGGQPAVGITKITLDGTNAVLKVKGVESSTMPSLGSVLHANQFDALLTWDAEIADRWSVIWKKDDKNVETVETNAGVCHLAGLKPGTVYTVEISPLTGDYAGQTEKISLQTETVPDSARNAYIALTGDEYDASEPVMLSLRNFTRDVGRIEWSVDGAATKETYRKLDTGEHSIMAVVYDTNGHAEYLVKYITVN